MTTEAILFDLDDTLVAEKASARTAFLAAGEIARERYGLDPEALHRSVLGRAREFWRASPTITYCRRIGISSWEGLWARFAGDDPNMKALRAWAPDYRQEAWSSALAAHGVADASFPEELSAAFVEQRSRLHVVFPDVPTTLDHLQEAYPLALVTNGAPELQRHKIEGAGLARYFGAIIISGEAGVGKPDPQIFALAVRKLGVRPGASVMVGDSLRRDVAGAQQAGLKGIWMNRSGHQHSQDIRPDAQIASLAELCNVLP